VGSGYLFGASFEGVGFGLRPELVELRHGNAPVGHGAGRVVLGDGFELHLGLGVAEGVQERDATLHGRLRARGA